MAIKKFKEKYYTYDAAISITELRALSKLNHPNIIRLKEVIRESDLVSIVMELAEAKVLEFTNRDENKICKALHEMFNGLAYMHSKGFIHRDLKPDNLLIANGIAKLGDLGIVKELKGSKKPYTAYFGTLWYNAPEVLMH